MSPAERKRIAAALRKLTGEWFDPCPENDLLRAAADLIDPPEPPGTVRVRVAVVTTFGKAWSAYGTSAGDDNEAERVATEGVWRDEGATTRLAWVEASVPLPEPPAVVEGSVTP